MKRVLYIIFLSLLAFGCSKSSLGEYGDSVAIEFTNSCSITKATENGTEPTTEEMQLSLVSTSTNEIAPHTSCPYIYNYDDGSFTRKEGTTGLFANMTSYYLIIATPASEMQKIGSSSAYGHLIERSAPFYINEPIPVSVDGIQLNNGAEASYICNLGDVKLSEKRSRVIIRLKSDPSADARTVSSLRFSDVYEKAYTNHLTGVDFSDDYPNDGTVNEFTEFQSSDNGVTYINKDTYEVAETDNPDNSTYFISADYSAKDSGHSTLVVGLKDGENTREVDVPLNILMEPMKVYTYDINISSFKLTVNVSALDWNNGGDDTIIGGNEVTKFVVDITSGNIEWITGGDNSSVDEPKEDNDEIVKEDFTDDPNSNCYILNPDANGTSVFYIPIDRIDEFWQDETYVDNPYTREANKLSTVKADGGWEAVMYWHDFNNPDTYKPINEVKFEQATSPFGEECVKVSLPKEFAEPANHCNIGYVVRKTYDEKKILWSWHLWITDYNPYETPTATDNEFVKNVPGGELHRYDNEIFNNGIYSNKLIMDRNLGARSADFDWYSPMTSNVFTAPGTIYYQFGRKDPFPAYWSLVNGYTYAAQEGKLSFEDSVNNPNDYIQKGYDNWCSEGDDNDYIWNDYKIKNSGYDEGKSIFDPSPQGFRVPLCDIWDGFTSSNAYNENIHPDNYNFKLINNIDGSLTIPYDRMYKDFAYFPASSYRHHINGKYNITGGTGWYWSASASEKKKAKFIYFTNEIMGITSTQYRALACPIRPVQE